MDRNEFNAAAIPDYRGHIAILSVFVLPRFKTFFASFHAKLPLATRMVLTAGGFVGTWWWALLTGVVVVGAGLFGSLRTAAGRRGLGQDTAQAARGVGRGPLRDRRAVLPHPRLDGEGRCAAARRDDRPLGARSHDLGKSSICIIVFARPTTDT